MSMGFRRSERGAVLVHVAIAILALTAFTTFVVDYGVLWAARRQAQNAADSAALAGATSFAFDSLDMTTSGPAYMAADAMVKVSQVWGQVPVGVITFVCPPGETGECIRVDVHRNVAQGNPLPTFFGTLLGIVDQDIRATATARVAIGNATDCLKPWAVIDKWGERAPINPGTWTTSSVYDKYINQGQNRGDPDPTIVPPDYYTPPTTSSTGTGFHPFDANRNYTSDYGLQIQLKVGDKTDFQYASGWFAPLALFDSRGGNDYSNNIKGCVGVTYKIGDELDVETEPGQKVGPTSQAVETDIDSLVNKDPGASWSSTANNGYGGVINSAFAVSPRIVPVPLIDPDEMMQVQKGGRTKVTVRNIMGFFVEGYDTPNKAVIGRLMTMPGLKTSGPAPIGGQSAFMQSIMLIR